MFAFCVLLGLLGRFFAVLTRSSKTTSKKHRKKIWKSRILASQNPSKILPKRLRNRCPKKHRNCHRFFSVFYPLLQKPNLDFVRMAIIFLGFYTIDAFACGMRFGSHNHAKNSYKTRSESFQNRCRKYDDFQHRFSEVSASIWEGLGPPRCSQVGHFDLKKLSRPPILIFLS